MSNPYLNNYYGQYPQYQQPYPSYQPQAPNPYADQRLQNLQQFQQSLQQPAVQRSIGLNGRAIDDISSVTANEVPMDGSVSLFPKMDMSVIYAKTWNADGTIKTIAYKPILDQDGTTQVPQEKEKFDLSDELTGAFMKRFDNIENTLNNLSKSLSAKPVANARTKKESETE